MAVVGLVKTPESAVDLWFVPREGVGTLMRSEESYELRNATLAPDFREDLYAQLITLSLRAVSSVADSDKQRRLVFANTLETLAEKLNALINTAHSDDALDRPALWEALATTLVTLGEHTLLNVGNRQRGAEQLRKAIDASHKALENQSQPRPLEHLVNTKSNLARALSILGDVENDTKRLSEAIDVYKQVLAVVTRDWDPTTWAMTRVRLGHALTIIGDREANPTYLQQAIAIFNEVLSVVTRDRDPGTWAATQGGLGNAFMILGERGTDTDLLEQAVDCVNLALAVYTREQTPIHWAAEQTTLGKALSVLGERRNDPELQREADVAFKAALEVRSRDHVPALSAESQRARSISSVPQALATGDVGRLKQVVADLNTVLIEYGNERASMNWARTQNDLGAVLLKLGEKENDAEHFEQAVAALSAALDLRTLEHATIDWAPDAKQPRCRVPRTGTTRNRHRSS